MSGRASAYRGRRGRRPWPYRGPLGGAVTVLAIALTSSVGAAPARASATGVVLQMNPCNSGAAKACYSFGASVENAVTAIHQYRPQMVTFQEICRNDVYAADG